MSLLSDSVFTYCLYRESVRLASAGGQLTSAGAPLKRSAADVSIDQVQLLRCFAQGDGVAHKMAHHMQKARQKTQYSALTLTLLDQCWEGDLASQVTAAATCPPQSCADLLLLVVFSVWLVRFYRCCRSRALCAGTISWACTGCSPIAPETPPCLMLRRQQTVRTQRNVVQRHG